MRRKITVLLAGLVVCVMALSGCLQEDIAKGPVAKGVLQGNSPMFQDPAVNLERGVLRAAGTGLPPKGEADAQAKLLARRAAITDGQRNLAQEVVELERRVGLARTTDPDVNVKKFSIVEERSLSDGGYRVVLEMKLDETLLTRLRQR